MVLEYLWNCKHTHKSIPLNQVRTYICHLVYMYHIVQNSGGGKLWRIWRIRSNSPKFYPSKFTFKKLRIVDYQIIHRAKMHAMSVLKYFRPLREKPDLPDSSAPLKGRKLPPTAIVEVNVKVNEAELKN